MLALTIALFAVTFLAEAAGFSILVSEARHSAATLEKWVAANPKGNDEGSGYQILLLNRVMVDLLGNRGRRNLAVGLVGAGIVFGAAANFVSLGV